VSCATRVSCLILAVVGILAAAVVSPASLAIGPVRIASSTAYSYDRSGTHAPTHDVVVAASPARGRGSEAERLNAGSSLPLGASVVAAEGIPDSAVVVRGGTADLPAPGETFSGSHGSDFEEAARGVPHGQVRQATAGEIRASGGSVEYKPEFDTRVGRTNYQHVDVCLGPGECPFGELEQNPWPRKARWGGPDYPYAEEP
jgi:hypothetical protein